ncbi:hypothetical protein B0H19DRAFT_1082805 [Mycena capillaripes]|nr:hypothetical protein B0H19DRAFT_1082805 [Mycena capillaripes]
MRGAERPGKSNGIDHSSLLSSLCLYSPQADDPDAGEESALGDLLDLSGSLFLAASLMANIASFEGYSDTLARWRNENTTLLSDGHDKRSNLEKSIILSLGNPRVSFSPHAKSLLSLLSSLPDGIRAEEDSLLGLLTEENSALIGIGDSIITLDRCSATTLKGRSTLFQRLPHLIEVTGDAGLRWTYTGRCICNPGLWPLIENEITFLPKSGGTILSLFQLLAQGDRITKLALLVARQADDMELQLICMDTEFSIAERAKIHIGLWKSSKRLEKLRGSPQLIGNIIALNGRLGAPTNHMGNLTRAIDLCTHG